MAASEAGRRRAKRATYPLDEKVKARLRGDDCGLAGSLTSSGSEHEVCALPGFVEGFFFFSSDDEDATAGGFEGGEDGDAGSDGEGDRSLLPRGSMATMVRELLGSWAGKEDRFGRDLAADVTEAVERLDGLRSCRPGFRRAVMSALREAGYNADICKARWSMLELGSCSQRTHI